MSTRVNYGGIISEILFSDFEIEHIQNTIKNMPEDGLMVQWGNRGEVCAWLDVLGEKQRLISIESDEAWYGRVNRAIKNHFGDVSSKYLPLHIPTRYIEHTYGSPMEEHPIGTDDYIFPTNKDIFNADVYLIDGLARATCALTVLLKHKKKNPVIFIHDYVGREAWYSWATQFFYVDIIGDVTKTERESRSALVRLHIKEN